VLVTLRAGRGGLRAPPVFLEIVRELVRFRASDVVRVNHFSVQADHIHLIVEAVDSAALRKGLHSLAARLAHAIGRGRGRGGRVWADRWDGRELTSPRQVRTALVYVLMNVKKHNYDVPVDCVDGCSSARFFDGWRDWSPPARAGPCPVSSPRTWLGCQGWRRHGLVSIREAPAARAHSARRA